MTSPDYSIHNECKLVIVNPAQDLLFEAQKKLFTF
jgi:hypothetical protein